jgi:hypothetical protein
MPSRQSINILEEIDEEKIAEDVMKFCEWYKNHTGLGISWYKASLVNFPPLLHIPLNFRLGWLSDPYDNFVRFRLKGFRLVKGPLYYLLLFL